MEYLNFAVVFGIAFITVFFSTPEYIRKFRMHEFTVPDMYKHGIRIPTMGGFAILGGVLVALTAAIFLVPDVRLLLLFYFIILVFGMFGILDDMVNVGRILKIFAPFFMALPIALINQDTNLWFFYGQIELGILYSFTIAPLYVMVTTNLVNMHSGFNGLQTGLSLLLFGFLSLYALIHGETEKIMFIMPVFGALAAFYLFNRYPSRIFEGNCGALAIGAAVGSFIVLLGNEIFGVILLAPHILNFLLYLYWRARGFPATKFGTVREDGTIDVPNNLTLKWIPPYYSQMTEQKATRFMFVCTIISGVLAMAIAG